MRQLPLFVLQYLAPEQSFQGRHPAVGRALGQAVFHRLIQQGGKFLRQFLPEPLPEQRLHHAVVQLHAAPQVAQHQRVLVQLRGLRRELFKVTGIFDVNLEAVGVAHGIAVVHRTAVDAHADDVIPFHSMARARYS